MKSRTTVYLNRIFILIIGLFSYSCIPYEELLNYQNNFSDSQKFEISNLPKLTIQTNDVLSITVHSSDVTTAAPFNVGQSTEASTNAVNVEAIQLGGYLVDKDGFIEFPVLGKIKVKGLTTNVAKQLIRESLIEYIKDPTVNLRLLNFRVSVTGEVSQPGTFLVFNERITIPEAIARAGGLTTYANRENVQLIREKDGIRTFHRINLKTADAFSSQYYYLQQNDMIYIEPLRAKQGAINDQLTKTIPIITAVATLVAVIVSISNNP